MTLQDTIRAIELVASGQPSVNMLVRSDIFRLNAAPDARYGVFAWLQNQHTLPADSSFINYAFTFFYVDRLTSDLSNQEEIQSVGITTLTNIIRRLEELGIYTEQDTYFQVFNQRFSDQCAGVFCNVVLQVPADGLCGEGFADFNDDFNEDFLIF